MKKPEFTDRQILILDMIAEQESIRAIAKMLNCHESNIQHLRQRIREEIGLEKNRSLNKWVYRNWRQNVRRRM